MLYTIVPPEILFGEEREATAPWVDQPLLLEPDVQPGPGWGNDLLGRSATGEREVRLSDVLLVVRPLEGDPLGAYEVVRVISSNPSAYLHPAFQPGAIWPFFSLTMPT
ncbi:MAG: YlzJ-like family protein [Limnochordales bacterium]|nr:YlzJ-like family protein [Limnochordales bacterium]